MARGSGPCPGRKPDSREGVLLGRVRHFGIRANRFGIRLAPSRCLYARNETYTRCHTDFQDSIGATPAEIDFFCLFQIAPGAMLLRELDPVKTNVPAVEQLQCIRAIEVAIAIDELFR